LVRDIPAGDGKIHNIFLHCIGMAGIWWNIEQRIIDYMHYADGHSPSGTCSYIPILDLNHVSSERLLNNSSLAVHDKCSCTSVCSYTDINSPPIGLFSISNLFSGPVNYPWTDRTRKEMQELDARTYSGQYRVERDRTKLRGKLR